MRGVPEAMERDAGLRLAELLATRLCHDVSGPLSGLVAALGEVGTDVEALPLALDAATALRRRLALLRAAWGAPDGRDAAGLRALLGGVPRPDRLRLEFAGPIATRALPPLAARLLLNALLLATESLPRGGVVTVEGDPAGTLVLGIDGAGAAWPAGLAAMLADADAAWQCLGEGVRGPRLQAAVTALLAWQARAPARLLLGAGSAAAAPVLFDFGAGR